MTDWLLNFRCQFNKIKIVAYIAGIKKKLGGGVQQFPGGW